MSLCTRALARLAAVSAASALLAGAFTSPSSAAAAEQFPGEDRPVVQTIAPGATSTAQLAINNASGVKQTLPAKGIVVRFTAPQGATFADQLYVKSQVENNAREEIASRDWLNLNSCKRSDNNRKLACEIESERPALSWEPMQSHAFFPMITINKSTPLGKTLAPGSGTFSFTAQGGRDKGRSFVVTMSMHVRTPRTTPVCVDPGSNPTYGTQPTIGICQDGASQAFRRYGDVFENTDTRLCLNVGPNRNNGDPVRLRPCQAANPDQELAPGGGKIKVRDTIGTAKEMCLGVGWPLRKGAGLRIWECFNTPGQALLHRKSGQIAVKATLENP
ncbi:MULTISPECIES: hypothetical protein [unclassified Streptomyces]|uniref:RICIN domain-containing protein n=1 Tax=unclassified Streptomyces TaxID=2593676 RepID=UPI002E1853AE|nr:MULTISPECIES: hypothetical protein [unclassified Streptomyces]